VLIRLGTARLGESVVIREATTDDARGIKTTLLSALQEPENNLSTTEESQLSEQQQRAYIKKLAGNDNDLMLVSEVISQSMIVGVLTCRGKTQKSRRHVVRLGITIQKDWRGQGIGTRLIQEAIRWAKRHNTIRRIELDVLARNTGAVSLYSRLGFRVEGRGIGAVYKDGEYLDNYWMALNVVADKSKQ